MSFETETLEQRWQAEGKCVGQDPSLWFPARNKETYGPTAKIAKGICKGKDGKAPCPVRKQCLLWAFIGGPDGTGEEHGIWGGYSHRERNVIQRRASKERQPIAKYVEGMP